MKSFKIHILEADNTFYEGECESLMVPTSNGQYGVLAGHSNTITAIVPGIMTYRTPGGEDLLASVSAGLLKIENNDVLVLVDAAERPEDIDANRARRLADAAKEAMLQKKSILEYRAAQTNLSRAIAQLRFAGSRRGE